MTLKDAVSRALPLYSTPMSADEAGTRNAALGLSFELLLTITNKRYECLGLGTVVKNYPKASVFKGKYVPRQKLTVDYTGYLNSVGFVAFETKTTSDDFWTVDRRQLHQLLYLLRGQREMPRLLARFFYLVQRRRMDDSTGSIRALSEVYLVEDLEGLVNAGRYEFHPRDLVSSGAQGVLVDYRAKLVLCCQ